MVSLEELENFDVSDLPLQTRINAIFSGTEELRIFAEFVVIPILQEQIDLASKEAAIRTTYFRMYLLLKSAVALNNTSHLQTTASIARSLFESLLDIINLDKGDDSTVKKFHLFPQLEKYRRAKKLIDFYKMNPDLDKGSTFQQIEFLNKQPTEEIDEVIIELWGQGNKGKRGKTKTPDHWTGKNIYDRAKELGKVYEKLYVDSFPRLSWYIHSGSMGFAGMSKEGLESFFALSHGLIQYFFLEATAICSKIFKISEEGTEGLLVPPLEDILEDIRLTPGKVLVEEQIKILKQKKKS